MDYDRLIKQVNESA